MWCEFMGIAPMSLVETTESTGANWNCPFGADEDGTGVAMEGE
jgi:hypothetical protein